MWYLVVPPIVVILSLFFLLWYLSRKGDDPLVAQKIRENGETHSRFFLNVKEFFLKRIEKLAQRFKVALLRAHNALNEFTQSVKKTRTGMQPKESHEEARPEEVVSESVKVDEEPRKERVGFWSSRKRGSEDVRPEPAEQSARLRDDILSTVIVRKEKGSEKRVSSEVRKELPSRPMVSEAVTHPETRRSNISDGGLREEDLIARIARDPKDFTAYEELGDYYLETGNIKDAKECYRQVLKLSPVHRMVKIKIRRLEKLLTRGGE
jgi:hypothetical protein